MSTPRLSRYPQHHTLAAVARVAGLEFQLVEMREQAQAPAAAGSRISIRV